MVLMSEENINASTVGLGRSAQVRAAKSYIKAWKAFKELETCASEMGLEPKHEDVAENLNDSALVPWTPKLGKGRHKIQPATSTDMGPPASGITFAKIKSWFGEHPILACMCIICALCACLTPKVAARLIARSSVGMAASAVDLAANVVQEVAVEALGEGDPPRGPGGEFTYFPSLPCWAWIVVGALLRKHII